MSEPYDWAVESFQLTSAVKSVHVEQPIIVEGVRVTTPKHADSKWLRLSLPGHDVLYELLSDLNGKWTQLPTPLMIGANDTLGVHVEGQDTGGFSFTLELRGIPISLDTYSVCVIPREEGAR